MKHIAQKVISKAKEILNSNPHNGSAQLCIEDAQALFEREEYRLAIKRIEKSIVYSIGVYSLEGSLSEDA